MSGETALFVGGVRSGKSALAQRWAEAQAPRRLFWATCRPEDAEMHQRVAQHRAMRGEGWACVEEPLDPGVVLGAHARVAEDCGVVLLDCVSLWLANLLAAGLSAESVTQRVHGLVELVRAARLPVGLVSTECGCGMVPASTLGRVYQDMLGFANQQLARATEHVVLAVCGQPLALKGGLPAALLS